MSTPKRITTINNQDVMFFMPMKGNLKFVEVANISETGLALPTEQLGFKPIRGAVLSGVVRIGSRQFSVLLKNIHNTGPLSGCTFIKSSTQMRGHIKNLFKDILTE